MTLGLRRWQQEGHLHFVTFSYAERKPYLIYPEARDLFLESLERARTKYDFNVFGYVVMPEHVHLLLSEPSECPLPNALASVKLSVSKQSQQRPFWTKRYHDFNVYTREKRVEKLRYIHRNPVERGLVGDKLDWPWSSYRFYDLGTLGPVGLIRYEDLPWNA